MSTLSTLRFHGTSLGLLCVTLFTLPGCEASTGQNRDSASGNASISALPEPDSDNGGLTLPDGFRALVVADNLGRARHIVVRGNGDIYVALRQPSNGGGIVCLRDTNNDGRADVQKYFGDVSGTGIDIYRGYLYFGERTRIVRYRLRPDALVPDANLEVVVDGFPRQQSHAAKPIAFDDRGHLYVNLGVPSNACQEQIRTPGSPGQRPCPELDGRGIYRYDADRLNQQHPDDGLHFATGLRQTVALAWNPHVKHLYLVMHGRDQLNTLFPEHYSDRDNAELPAEEFHLVRRGLDAGWPYTYWDPRKAARMMAPEYGGDGQTRADIGKYAVPIQAFPAHWAPNDLIFYAFPRASADSPRPAMFPERYRNGAFVAFHGSWNRAPLPQAGYQVTFTPFDGALPVKAGAAVDADGEKSPERSDKGWEVFADGFAGQERLASPGEAEHRPMGLARGPDGSLYIADSVRGTIWRVMYSGE